jgi:hypothetical protein
LTNHPARLYRPRVTFRAPSLLVALLAVAALTCGCGSSGDSDATEVRIFSALNGNNEPSVPVGERDSGECWATSAPLAGRGDAFRCSAGNQILDPCFLTNDDSRVLCVGSPWEHSSTELTLDAPISVGAQSDTVQDSTIGSPWALVLADGNQRCTATGGATKTLAGKRLNYTCEDSGTQLWGEPDRTAATWKVFASTGDDPTLKQMDVAVAWF